jgi:hypothetical protein
VHARDVMKWLLLCVLLMAGCSRGPQPPHIVVRGGDGGGIPHALPAEEHLDAAALVRAGDEAAAGTLQAFVVMRHGHIVFERYGRGIDAGTVAAPEGFAPAVLAMATGIAVRDDVFPLPASSGFDAAKLRQSIEGGTHSGYADYLSMHLWQRVNAGDAWMDDCCLHARLLDWLRVADLLVEDGWFEGKQVVPAGWVARMMHPVVADRTRGFGVLLPAAVQGEPPFDRPDVFFLRDSAGADWHLWLVPGLHLAVLYGGRGSETRLPNQVMQALSEPGRADDESSKLKGLVPGH